MLLPYRVKNPPLAFPYATIGLIVVNTVIYALTSDSFSVVKESVVETAAVTHNNLNLIRVLSAMFLHGNLMHLIGNMLFLWIFGAATEGRLGIPLYLGLYITTGVAGTLCHDFMSGIFNPDIPTLGASGAIMGLMGAYLYLSPFAQVMIAYFVGMGFRIRAGVANWQAQWVILLYAFFDIMDGFLYRGTPYGSTANFAHLGGMGAGFLLMLASGMRRESEDYAEAQATRSDMGGHLLSMNQYELQSLMEGPAATPEVVLTFCRKSLTNMQSTGGKTALEAMTKHSQMLLDKGDPEQTAIMALQMPSAAGSLPGPFLLRLAGKLESGGDYALAEKVYQALLRGENNGSEIEMGLMRLARLTEQTHADKGQSSAIYAELLRRFPNGPQAPYARQAIQRLGQPTVVFSTGNASPAAAADVPAGHPVPAPLGGFPAPVGAPAPLAAPSLGGVAPVGSMATVGVPEAAPAAGGMASLGGMAPIAMPTVAADAGTAPVPLATPGVVPPPSAPKKAANASVDFIPFRTPPPVTDEDTPSEPTPAAVPAPAPAPSAPPTLGGIGGNA